MLLTQGLGWSCSPLYSLASKIATDINKYLSNKWSQWWMHKGKKYYSLWLSSFSGLTCFLFKNADYLQIFWGSISGVEPRIHHHKQQCQVLLMWGVQGPHFDKHCSCWTCKTFDLKLPTQLPTWNYRGQHLEEQSSLPLSLGEVMTCIPSTSN